MREFNAGSEMNSGLVKTGFPLRNYGRKLTRDESYTLCMFKRVSEFRLKNTTRGIET